MRSCEGCCDQGSFQVSLLQPGFYLQSSVSWGWEQYPSETIGLQWESHCFCFMVGSEVFEKISAVPFHQKY